MQNLNVIVDVINLTPPIATREEWLNLAVTKLRDGIFKDADAVVPMVKVATGFLGVGMKRKSIGVYYPEQMTTDNMPQIYISPTLGDHETVLSTLVHELVHAVHPTAKHGKVFGKLARAVGLEGKLTATVAGESLKAKLATLANDIGPYPHGAIVLKSKEKTGVTTLFKLQCSKSGYVLRGTKKQLEMFGVPFCPCHNEKMKQDEVA